MFLENSSTFYDRQIIGVPKLKMSKLSIIGIWESLKKLNKSNPLRCMENM